MGRILLSIRINILPLMNFSITVCGAKLKNPWSIMTGVCQKHMKQACWDNNQRKTFQKTMKRWLNSPAVVPSVAFPKVDTQWKSNEMLCCPWSVAPYQIAIDFLNTVIHAYIGQFPSKDSKYDFVPGNAGLSLQLSCPKQKLVSLKMLGTYQRGKKYTLGGAEVSSHDFSSPDIRRSKNSSKSKFLYG